MDTSWCDVISFEINNKTNCILIHLFFHYRDAQQPSPVYTVDLKHPLLICKSRVRNLQGFHIFYL